MWKERAVVGGAVGGIRYQIEHGYSGFLVANVDEAAQNIAVLLRDRALRRNMGRRAQQRVRRRFLMTRLLEDWLDLIASLTLQRPAGSCVQERASAA